MTPSEQLNANYDLAKEIIRRYEALNREIEEMIERRNSNSK